MSLLLKGSPYHLSSELSRPNGSPPQDLTGFVPKILDDAPEIPDNYVSVADVAELADAQASGACALRGVEVRLLSSAIAGLPVTGSPLFVPITATGSTI